MEMNTPGEMAEATPANEQANTVMVHTMRNGSGWLCSCVHCDRLRAAAKGGDAHANEARHRPGLSEASNAVTGAGASVTTPRAAPQRQNLAYWLGLRGRAPWPVEARKRLDPLLASAFRVWK